MDSDSRPPDGQNNPQGNKQIVDTLSTILAQLTTINKRLELQSESIARYDQLLGDTNGSTAPKITADKASGSGTTDNGGGSSHGTSGDNFLANNQPSHRDYQEELCNSFHRPKLSFPRYDGETDPLPWLNRCKSYFRGTHTMNAKQDWLSSYIWTMWQLSGIMHLNGTTTWFRGKDSRSLLI
jgi:hypothetical protein